MGNCVTEEKPFSWIKTKTSHDETFASSTEQKKKKRKQNEPKIAINF